MIDSINTTLKVKKSQIYNFKKRFKRCSKDYVYSFKYKGIHFNYYLLHSTLTLSTHASSILHKNNIVETDVNEYLDLLYKIIKEVVDIDEINLSLSRCDYCVDLKVASSEEIHEIFMLLNKHYKKFRYIESKQEYENGIYLCKPKSSFNINIYNKYEQLLNQFGYEDENFKNTIRVELQLKKWKINRLYRKNNLDRDVKKYWCKETMEKEYFQLLQQYLYVGDYYKLSKAKELILSSTYSKTVKKGLINFIENVNAYGITIASSKRSYNTIRRYISILNELKINPITINDDSKFLKIENIINRVKKLTIETKFDN